MTRLPLGWEWTTLGEIAENVKNGIFISRPGTEPRGVPILRISSVRPMRLNVEDIRYSSLESAELAQRDALLSSGDLLFTRYSGNPEYVGACAVVPEGTGQLTYPDKLIRVRLDARTADPRFVAPTFAWEGVKAQVRSVVKTTAGQVGISGRDLRSIRIPLSSLAEQRRIVAVLEDHLSRLDKATQYLNRVRTNIRTLTGAVRETEVGRSREHPLPNGWRWGLIRDVIVEIEAGKSFACESRPARDDEWGVIKVSAMTWGEFREAENKAVPPGRFVDSRHEIRPGDILISRANTPAYVGASVLVPKCRPKLILSKCN